MESISKHGKDGLWDQIVMVYITFLSMETRDIALSHIFRSDGKIPKPLSDYYKNTLKQDDSTLARIKGLLPKKGDSASKDNKEGSPAKAPAI